MTGSKEEFRDEALKAKATDKAAYDAGIVLCDSLLAATEARENGLSQLADSKAKQTKLYDERTGQVFDNNRPFFDAQIHKRWAEESARRRQEIEALYA